MSIAIQNITKRYGTQIAVDSVSFNVKSGEIVGFIGPNGAGKSTTMKIITGTLPPDEGTVTINGRSILSYEKKIRRIIGYLPEHNPLYLELYIREYLKYVAGLYGITGHRATARIKEVVRMTGLEPEIKKKLGALSKGFRQRVGLAQSLVHDPEILILDEPTSGLDPNQLAEIRTLISSIGKTKTILLSTHILQEVEAICDRVIIINKGRIVADEHATSLKTKREGEAQTILIETDRSLDTVVWEKLPFVENARHIQGTQVLLETFETRDVRGEVSNFAVGQGLTILSLQLKQKSLEEVFREITNQ
ncbi:MAG: gliding motility-associated ABC transporter ATP-binding subunit GldA [Anaerolineales bacterium]